MGRAQASGSLPDAGVRAASTQRGTTRSYISAPTLHPPIIHFSGRVTDPHVGDVFLDAEQTSYQAPFVVNPKGELIWMPSSESYPAVFDLRVQRYASQPGKRAQPVLTFWEGTLKGDGDGDGVGAILNQHYQQIATIQAGKGYASDGIDGHELTLTRGGTALVAVYAPTKANLTSVGGPANGTALDTLIQEIDVHTGAVVWEWHPLGHVPLRDSYVTYVRGQTYDAYHLNSIQQLPDGNLIVSMRNTWATYEINRKTGRIMWELGGKHSSFKMGQGTKFEWQHDAQLNPGSLLTVFDDAALPAEEKQSRALEIHLDDRHMRATLRHAFKHNPPVLAGSEGSAQLLPNKHLLVGWGFDASKMAAGYSEYTSTGHQEFTASFVWPATSYRAYRFPWTGKPSWPPSIAARSTSTANVDDVYVSWDGATQVAKWQVLGSTTQAGTFQKLGSRARWSGFQTKIPVTTSDTWFEVEALDASGKLLPHGTSESVQARTG